MSINIEQAGNPRRRTKDNGDSKRPNSGKSSSGERSKRISVTPNDPEKLKEVADELGLPMSKVYNMGFRALLEKLGME